MKITKASWKLGYHMGTREFYYISDAVVDATQSNAELSELVGRLCEVLFDGTARPKHEAISYILGLGYEVEE